MRAPALRRVAGGIAVCSAIAFALEVGAQCLGTASSATSSTMSTGCHQGTPPFLEWNFHLLCRDECGNVYFEFPTATGRVEGACNFLPPFQICVPFFDQLDHNSGLYAVTSARHQVLLAGCRASDTAVITQGDCPCAPGCNLDPEPNVQDPGTPPTVPGYGGYGSPILLTLGEGRFELTSAADGVVFDIDGDERPERVAWTRAGCDEAFLALDRNANGTIDHGRELFGDFSPQLPSAEANGFRALALFDEPQNGGNANGWLGPEDAIFEALLLWSDVDHDGVSDADELVPVADTGLEGIDLGYRAAGRRDEHGNQFRYRADTRWRGGARRPAWDVFFQVLPAD